jgi:hypothetical protein
MNCTVREKEKKKVEVLIVKSFMHLPIEKKIDVMMFVYTDLFLPHQPII